MRRITTLNGEPLFDVSTTRTIEQAALAAQPPHALMARAGLAVARLARALAPHARSVWVACGPGNNGGDGLVAATHLHHMRRASKGQPGVVVTLCADPTRLPPDAAWAYQQALSAGIHITTDPPAAFDIAIDALLGIGHLRSPTGRLAEHLERLQHSTAPVLCVDLPSGLEADTGRHCMGPRLQTLPGQRHTLSLLTLKPGLFTADGRDQAGTVWLDDLGIAPNTETPPRAWLHAASANARAMQSHATHKGSQGDVLVLGGQDIADHGIGMTGAAMLAARAALHAGAGRVYLGLPGANPEQPGTGWDPVCPELMVRLWSAIRNTDMLAQASVVCGCGGGQAIAAILPQTVQQARSLVLDADALNTIATNGELQAAVRARREQDFITVLTPHPLEAARLLGTATTAVMDNRLAAAQAISERFDAICVLKGSGTVISAPGMTPRINSSGNASLATAGTGDVLAGMLGAALARQQPASQHDTLTTVADAVHHHGWVADQWLDATQAHGTGARLTADALARTRLPRAISPAR